MRGSCYSLRVEGNASDGYQGMYKHCCIWQQCHDMLVQVFESRMESRQYLGRFRVIHEREIEASILALSYELANNHKLCTI